MNVAVQKEEPPITVLGLDHLDEIIANATQQAKSSGLISVILLDNDAGDLLGLAVGGDETVVTFIYGHSSPPHYVSKGTLDVEEPVFTCFALFSYPTKFSRKCVIPIELGITACHEFYNTGSLPKCIEWVEV